MATTIAALLFPSPAQAAGGWNWSITPYMWASDISEKHPDAEQGWAHTRIILKPLNPKHEPIELTPQDEGEVQVIAEFLEDIEARDEEGK